MSLDPLGYYARLGVGPDSSHAALKAAYRGLARRLHPDTPGTGDAAAFLRLKEAYDALASPERRTAYHRRELDAGGAPPRPYVRPRYVRPQAVPPRWGPWLAAIGAGVIVLIAVIAALPRMPRADAPNRPHGDAARTPDLAPPTLVPAGVPDHYLLPAAGPAVVWRANASGTLTRLGTLADFTPVHAAAAAPALDGLAALTLAGRGVGYVDAARLIPGDPAMARRASCAYFAGAPPANAEVLAASGRGEAGVRLANASDSPAVVVLRNPGARTVAWIYLAPRGDASLAGLPAGPWVAEIAFGELWSRSCRSFVAGERVRRAGGSVPEGGRLTIGPLAPDN